MLEELGHPQTLSLVDTDNFMAYVLLTKSMNTKESKFVDMLFEWIKWHGAYDQFQHKYHLVNKNRAEHHNKHHPTQYHTKKVGITQYMSILHINRTKT